MTQKRLINKDIKIVILGIIFGAIMFFVGHLLEDQSFEQKLQSNSLEMKEDDQVELGTVIKISGLTLIGIAIFIFVSRNQKDTYIVP